MTLQTTDQASPRGHAHDVSVDTTFDFLNTLDTEDGFPVEKLPTLDLALGWFADRGLIHVEGADRARREAADRPDVAERDIERVHTVRGALREVADAVVEHRVPRGSALSEVNRALHARQVIELVAASDGVHVDHRHVGDPVDDALARLSDAMVRELTSGQPERIRVCASDTCNWVFYDASRTARRRWCDMATCGNRAKQARHRARTKADAGVEAAEAAGQTA
jgi:predicted RNA-binding Zn ribbon-like protein